MRAIVRIATTDDAASIVVLNAYVQSIHAMAHPWRYKMPGASTMTLADAEKLLASSSRFTFMADVDGGAVGYVNGEIQHHGETPYLRAHDMLYVHHIVVAPDVRKRGIGAQLMDAAKQHGASQGVTLMALTVWSFNEPARLFFRRYGLVPYSERLWNRID